MLLVGDSLGMIEFGDDNTLPVTMNDMVRHSQTCEGERQMRSWWPICPS